MQKFYLMDDSKRIRILVQDPKLHTLSVLTTLDLCKKDKELLKQTPFDEFAVSPGCIHWDNKALFMIDNKQKDNPTWYSFDVMIKNYEYVSGPKAANGSGQIYYMQNYTGVDDDEEDDLGAVS